MSRVGNKGGNKRGWVEERNKGRAAGQGKGGRGEKGAASRSVGGFVVVFPKGRQNNHSTPRRNTRGVGEDRSRGERKGPKVKKG